MQPVRHAGCTNFFEVRLKIHFKEVFKLGFIGAVQVRCCYIEVIFESNRDVLVNDGFFVGCLKDIIGIRVAVAPYVL